MAIYKVTFTGTFYVDEKDPEFEEFIERKKLTHDPSVRDRIRAFASYELFEAGAGDWESFVEVDEEDE